MTIDGRALIDAIPEEPPGPQGIPGSEGQQGIQGEPGSQGEPGVQGFQGVQGPPFAQAVVDGVTTLPPSDPATVQTTYDGVDVHFAFGTPQGYTGGRGRPGHKERRERCRWPN